ncbi:MAG TPA: DUF2231 domain-containing protein [Blastocatellia bacterium]|nr:DUF2231 domain-containing protein [Blastocatellia bacterium]
MKTPARIGSHPVHPMLIPFPFALWTFSLIADLIYYFGTNDYVWETVAFYTLAGGIAGGMLAAVPGIIDYFSINDKKVSKIANWHARLNLFALLVFAGSFYLRTDRGSRIVDGSLTIPVLLSLLGVMFIFASGWLGGEMVFRHGVGVDRGPDAETTDKINLKAQI